MRKDIKIISLIATIAIFIFSNVLLLLIEATNVLGPSFQLLGIIGVCALIAGFVIFILYSVFRSRRIKIKTK